MNLFEGIDRRPLYLQVAERVRRAILDGELAPGDPLPTERDLCDAFGVSRASVREALRALQAQGLVTGGGSPSRTVVSDGAGGHAADALAILLRLNAVGVADLMEFRSVLEQSALAAAARRRAAGALDEARAALDEMRRPDIGVEEYDRADVRFHLALVRASGNEAMFLVMRALREAVARHLLEHLRAQDDPRATLERLTREHEAILAAVGRGHAMRASALVRAHIRAFYEPAGGAPPGPAVTDSGA
ncbi:MAG: FadR/GntR family transcriptional regulator [Thermoleophilia bacterium]